MDICSLELFP